MLYATGGLNVSRLLVDFQWVLRSIVTLLLIVAFILLLLITDVRSDPLFV